MFFRLTFDHRVFLPLLMLGGLGTSLALSGPAKRHATTSFAAPPPSSAVLTSGRKSAETLPSFLDPGVAYPGAVGKPQPVTPGLTDWFEPNRMPPTGPRAEAPMPIEGPRGLSGAR